MPHNSRRRKGMPKQEVVQHFLSLAKPVNRDCGKHLPEPCLEIPKNLCSRGSTGYPHIGFEGKIRELHRLVNEVHHGPLGDLLSLHKCDNPACVNPDHLFRGTDADNSRDKRNKGRAVYPPDQKGEAHSQAVLTAEKVRAMRRMYATGKKTLRQIGLRFGISGDYVGEIVNRRKWKHVK